MDNRRSLRIAGFVLALLAALALVAYLLLPGPIDRDAPRPLPWQLPDYRDAEVHWEVAEDGRIHNRVQHYFLEGITPAMVAWFYRQLPVATVEYRGVTYPLYHIFHPSEHGTVSVIETAEDGLPGMGPGALIMREEWFGPYDSRGKARIVEFSDAGMLAVAEVAGITIGEIRHSYEARDGGTVYRVEAVIGSDLPIVGALVNLYLRNAVFHPAMMAHWQRHQVEEVASLQFFLPQLYRQRGQGNYYLLDP